MKPVRVLVTSLHKISYKTAVYGSFNGGMTAKTTGKDRAIIRSTTSSK